MNNQIDILLSECVTTTIVVALACFLHLSTYGFNRRNID